MGRLVRTSAGEVAVDLVVGAKGQTQPATERGAIRIARRIDTVSERGQQPSLMDVCPRE